MAKFCCAIRPPCGAKEPPPAEASSFLDTDFTPSHHINSMYTKKIQMTNAEGKGWIYFFSSSNFNYNYQLLFLTFDGLRRESPADYLAKMGPKTLNIYRSFSKK